MIAPSAQLQYRTWPVGFFCLATVWLNQFRARSANSGSELAEFEAAIITQYSRSLLLLIFSAKNCFSSTFVTLWRTITRRSADTELHTLISEIKAFFQNSIISYMFLFYYLTNRFFVLQINWNDAEKRNIFTAGLAVSLSLSLFLLTRPGRWFIANLHSSSADQQLQFI